MYVRIFMKILFPPQREMVQHSPSWGDSLPLPDTENLHQLWLLLSPQQTSVVPGSISAGWLRLFEFCLSAERTGPGHGRCWGLLACPSCLLQERGKICLCDFRLTVLNSWNVLLLKPISCPVSECRNYLSLCFLAQSNLGLAQLGESPVRMSLSPLPSIVNLAATSHKWLCKVNWN